LLSAIAGITLSTMDVGAFITALPSIIGSATSANEAWTAVLQSVGQSATLAPDLAIADITFEVELVAAQLRAIMTGSPPPAKLRLLYFGLFTAADPVTYAEQAGYYVVGSTREVPSIDTAAELADGVINYAPDERYLESPLLQRIKALALAEPALYTVYDYALMLGAAAVIGVFAVRSAGMQCHVVVGFDSGDAINLRA
jgi:hypothetical protein